MTMFALLSASLPAALGALLCATPVQAQAPPQFYKTYVSGTGSGAECSFTAPCNLFQTAHNVTVDGGEISCLNSGDFGGATITKSILIDCAGTSASHGGFTVNGAGISVSIRNLAFNGTGVPSTGIDFLSGAALFVENCVIQNYGSPPYTTPAIGIRFRPITTGAQLVVTDTSISNNGSGSTGGGIVVNPQSGGNARVTLNRVTVGKNVFGIVADGTGSTGGINMTISDSVSSGNSQDGIIAVTPGGGAPIGVYVKNTRSVNNSIGIRSIGPNVTVRVDGSSVIGNGTGLSFSGGGALLSAGNNMIQANGVNGAFSGSVGLQ